MSKVYSRAPDEVVARTKAIIERYCPDLKLAGVRIDLVSVANDEPDEPALKLHGYACAAVVRIVNAKDRAKGLGDAEIVIDEKTFTDLPDETKDALLHHELYHLEIVKNKYGRVVLDEQERPKLKMRLHDRQFGWFDEIARIHGKASMEIRQSSTFVLQAKQLYFFYALEEGFVPQDTQTELLQSDRTSVTVKIGEKTVFMSESPDDADTESLYTSAVAIVRETKRASTSTIQRRLRIGYNRAARLMDLMEHRGVVGPENGSSPREILEPAAV